MRTKVGVRGPGAGRWKMAGDRRGLVRDSSDSSGVRKGMNAGVPSTSSTTTVRGSGINRLRTLRTPVPRQSGSRVAAKWAVSGPGVREANRDGELGMLKRADSGQRSGEPSRLPVASS